MTAGYEQRILNVLLDKYERSKAYTENSPEALKKATGGPGGRRRRTACVNL